MLREVKEGKGNGEVGYVDDDGCLYNYKVATGLLLVDATGRAGGTAREEERVARWAGRAKNNKQKKTEGKVGRGER